MTDGTEFSVLLFQKAEQACISAQALLDIADADGACNRAYYAMFDAAKAALLQSRAITRHEMPRTHQGVSRMFNEHLIRAGSLSREFGRAFKVAEGIRIFADYREASVEPSDAIETVDCARQPQPHQR